MSMSMSMSLSTRIRSVSVMMAFCVFDPPPFKSASGSSLPTRLLRYPFVFSAEEGRGHWVRLCQHIHRSRRHKGVWPRQSVSCEGPADPNHSASCTFHASYDGQLLLLLLLLLCIVFPVGPVAQRTRAAVDLLFQHRSRMDTVHVPFTYHTRTIRVH